VSCSELRVGEHLCRTGREGRCQYGTICCSVLLCVAAWSNVLQCVVMCCSVLQCVAVWCSVVQCLAV